MTNRNDAGTASGELEFDVALSFSGRDRTQAEALAEELRRRGILVFYDRNEQHRLWGRNLVEVLTEVYQKRARFCLVLISANYVASSWPKLERQAAQARLLFGAEDDYVLPVRLDDSEVPGLLPTTAFLSWTEQSPADIADVLCKKLEISPDIKAINDLECFWYQDLLALPTGSTPRPAHIIAGVHVEETESGTEGDVVDALCGESMYRWGLHSSIHAKEGRLRQARQEGYQLCYQCAWLRATGRPPIRRGKSDATER